MHPHYPLTAEQTGIQPRRILGHLINCLRAPEDCGLDYDRHNKAFVAGDDKPELCPRCGGCDIELIPEYA